jgi:hypothetical protein
MYIYNVTIKINWAIHDNWVLWMQQEHLPQMLATNCFTTSSLLRLLQNDDEEGPTYVAQYTAESMEKIDEYIEKHSQALRHAGFVKWGDQFIAFRSILQHVN